MPRQRESEEGIVVASLTKNRRNPVTVLVHTPEVMIYDFDCPGHRFGQPDEELSGGHELVVVRGGCFTRHDRSGSTVADTRRAIFFNASEPYRIVHPRGCEDRCTVIRVDSQVLDGIAQSIRLRLRSDSKPFAASSVLASPLFQIRAANMRAAARTDRLAGAEEALGLMATAWRDSSRAQDSWRNRGAQRSRMHANLAADVHGQLAASTRKTVTLTELSIQVGVSVFHLARVYKQHTGCSIHRQFVRLRLSEALYEVLDTRRSITSIAHEFGFSDLAHFTRSFRQRFGESPSRLRGSAHVKHVLQDTRRLPRREIDT